MSESFVNFVHVCYDHLNERLQEISDFLYTNPELSGEEFKAHDYLSDVLQAQGFSVNRNYLDLPTAFHASFQTSDEGPTVCFICEYDALPDLGHACGHNLIAEAGIGAGIVAKNYLESSLMAGKIIVLGCPAEENGSHKVLLIERGAFENVDLVMMVHPHATSDELRPNLMGKSHFVAEFRGKAAHAAGAPWEGRNALDAVVGTYQSLSMLRQQTHPTCRIQAIIPNGGTSVNVIAEYSSIEIVVRASSLLTLDTMTEKVENCAKAAAISTDTSVAISTLQPLLKPLKSNNVLAGIFQNYAEQMGVQFADITGIGERFEASSDVGSVSWQVPVIQPAFHIDAKGVNHTREFAAAAGEQAAQPPTIRASKAMAMVALDVFNKPQLVDIMWKEHRSPQS